MKLNIQLFASGTINGSSTASSCDCRITWSSTSNTSTNSSSVTANIQIYRSGSGSTTGTFSGSITINGTKKEVSKKFSPYNYGSWVTVGSSTVSVAHNSDGTKSITIKGSLTQTGTSMAGTYSASGTAVLDTLHKAPEFDVSDITFTETNQDVIRASVPNYTYVNNLSQIRVELDETDVNYYDSATFKKLVLYEPTQYADEYNKYLELTTNPAIFTPTKSAYNNTLYFRLYDSLGASLFIDDTAIIFNTIDYTKVTINASVKRTAPTSGLVSINCNGTYYNGEIGNIDHSLSAYKPTITYSFYDIDNPTDVMTGTIPQANITASNGTYTVSNFIIGSADTTHNTTAYIDNHYFDYQKAYRFTLTVQDDYEYNSTTYYFTQQTTSEIPIPVGEATWTEYPEYVNFKKLKINKKQILAPYILFEDDSGTTSSITLDDDSANYEYADILYMTNDGNYGSTRVYSPDGKTVSLNANHDNGTYTYIKTAIITISGTSVTFGRIAQARIGDNVATTHSTGTGILVTRIIGYK